MRKGMHTPEHEFWEVYCDNKLVDYCIEADDEEDWAKYIDTDHPIINGSYWTKTITGKIEFKLKWKEYLEMIQCRYWKLTY
jgi:hypothetical protein